MEVFLFPISTASCKKATDSANVCLWENNLEKINLIPSAQPLNE